MYADDTNVFFSSYDITELEWKVNEYLKQLYRWLLQNKLELNVKKTTYIVFRPRNKNFQKTLLIDFNGITINQVKEQKFLGVWFEENLRWTKHINQLYSELSKCVGVIFRIAHLIPLWLKQQLYNTLFYSRLCYGALVWGTTTKTNYAKLAVLQKRVLRIYCNYTGRPADLRTAPLFERFSMLRADRIYYFKLLCTIHKEKMQTKITRNIPHYSLRYNT